MDAPLQASDDPGPWNKWAIASFVTGLLSVAVIFNKVANWIALSASLTGFVALSQASRKGPYRGQRLAWFGVIVGTTVMLAWLVIDPGSGTG